jgi:hypothetical protein
MSYGRPRTSAWDELSSDGDQSAGDDWEDFPIRPKPPQHLEASAGYGIGGTPIADHSDFSASAGQLSFDRREIQHGSGVQPSGSNFHKSMPLLGVGVGIDADESSLFLNMAAQPFAHSNQRREATAPQLPPPRAGHPKPPPTTTEEPAFPLPRRSNRFKFPNTRKADVVVGKLTDSRHADPKAAGIICNHCNATLHVPAIGATALVVLCSRCKNVTPNMAVPQAAVPSSFASFVP